MKEMWKDIPLRSRVIMLMIIDIVAIGLAGFLSLWMRFEFSFADIQMEYLEAIYHYMPINIVITVIVFWIFRMYSSLWKYASVNEFLNVVFAVIISSLINGIIMNVSGFSVPRSYPFMYMLFLCMFAIGVRFFYRFARHIRNRHEISGEDGKPANVMVIGAGDAGAAIIKEMCLSKYAVNRVRCVIDSNPAKHGKYIQGCPIVGGNDSILECVERYKIEKIVIAIPKAPKSTIKDLVDICKHTGCDIRILPGTYQLLNGEVSVSQLRKV